MMKKCNVQTFTKQKELFSFDIFDTLVTRRVATPTGIFAIVQNILEKTPQVNEFIKNNFYKIRVGAENFARHHHEYLHQYTEVTFDEIYKEIQENYDLTDEETNFIKELEISTEIKNLVPIDKNLNRLKELIKNNKHVVLISDMYYGEKYLKQILSAIDPIFNEIKIYSSADYRVSKADSSLYPIVQNSENVKPCDWIHCGDNKRADIKEAKYAGLKTVYTPAIALKKYEEKLLENSKNNMFYQATVGCSKIARLYSPKVNSDKFDFGASFAAPILYNYVDWILNRAIEKGFKTLYFVARDGFVPKVIADIIIEKRNLSIKTKYIYGSRRAWRQLTEDDYNALIKQTFEESLDNLNAEFLGYKLGIDSNKLASLLNLPSPKTKIKRKLAKDYAQICKTDENIKKELLMASEKRVKLLKKYFEQEIDFSEDNIVFVDLHGSDKTQDCAATILNQIKPCKLYGFYLTNGIDKTQNTDISVKVSYFSTKDYLSNWIELLCRATDGQTIGYCEKNNKIEPVTEICNGSDILRWGFEEYIEGIKIYTNLKVETEDINKINFNTLDLYCKYFDYLYKDLDKNTAIILGEIPYLSIGKENKNTITAAPRVHTWEFIFNFLAGKKRNKITEFPHISAARSSILSKKLQELTEECSSLQKFLFNVYIHKKKRKAYVRILGIKISFGGLLWKK